MNSKFRDLQAQAFDESKPFDDVAFRTDDIFQRFGELIIKEALAVMLDEDDFYGGMMGKVVAKHFDVKRIEE